MNPSIWEMVPLFGKKWFPLLPQISAAVNRHITLTVLTVSYADQSKKTRDTPQKFNIDTKNGHVLKGSPFPSHHFRYPS